MRGFQSLSHFSYSEFFNVSKIDVLLCFAVFSESFAAFYLQLDHLESSVGAIKPVLKGLLFADHCL